MIPSSIGHIQAKCHLKDNKKNEKNMQAKFDYHRYPEAEPSEKDAKGSYSRTLAPIWISVPVKGSFSPFTN